MIGCWEAGGWGARGDEWCGGPRYFHYEYVYLTKLTMIMEMRARQNLKPTFFHIK